ncbi:hypothetical protein TrLO_g14741 [Triparma laevis f. longispina]|uniref:Uncharacterized protein n=1 Tax=Triparma laevis f. longispina TaxID=1714387 RepID=A0A9W7FGQ0_9STRA|nr:hypothetical protein TrLO_g14741 [Triparma laevis f. longispina]
METPAPKSSGAQSAKKFSGGSRKYIKNGQPVPFSSASLSFLTSTIKKTSSTYISTRITPNGQPKKLENLVDNLLTRVRKRIVTTRDGGKLECPKLALRPAQPIADVGMTNAGAGFRPRKVRSCRGVNVDAGFVAA